MNLKNDRLRLIIGVIYCLFFVYLLFFASFREGTLTQVNWIPFKTTAELFAPFFTSPNIPSGQYMLHVFMLIFGNFLLLLPVPILFRLDWKSPEKWLFIILVPISIEIIQYFFTVGSADIDDVILNSAGCYFGFWIRAKRL